MNKPPQPGERVRMLLLDEVGLFRASLAHFLASQPPFEVTAECGKPEEALEVLRTSAVDLVLLDFDAGSKDGGDFISAAREAGYQGQFLIIAGSPDARKSAIALKHGASGIFLKSEDLNRLVQAITLVVRGDVWVDRTVIRFLAGEIVDGHHLGDHASKELEERERNVLRGILAGHTNRKIGDGMGLSESSVKNIVQRLFGKAGVNTRGQLVRAALEGSLAVGPTR